MNRAVSTDVSVLSNSRRIESGDLVLASRARQPDAAVLAVDEDLCLAAPRTGICLSGLVRISHSDETMGRCRENRDIQRELIIGDQIGPAVRRSAVGRTDEAVPVRRARACLNPSLM